MIDATTRHEALTFMDGSPRYNQIRMAPTRTDNISNPQRSVMLQDHAVRTEEYRRNLLEGYEECIRMLHKNTREYAMKKIIEQEKIDAIVATPKPKDLHEHKSLQGKLTYLRSFISNLAGKCQAFSRLMKKLCLLRSLPRHQMS
ncbi:hypothetical protein LIER_30441 [Lithospermum erythrorhizon]|uniref:Uncharacterized protein n=1 Tax=Lithospermum erythrorhizon TaxID=34254 RepID=A0AAV3RSW2_LITER